MKKIKKRFIAVILGLFCVIFLGEITLQITGFLFFKRNCSDAFDKIGRDDYVILCLGDSVTEGIGAPKVKSYPSQLEELLNLRGKEITFKVVNFGVGGGNTRNILNSLEWNICKVKPNLIVVLIGIANFWNFEGYNLYELRETFAEKNIAQRDFLGNGDFFMKKLLCELQDRLYKIRLYKLSRRLCFDLRQKIKEFPYIKKNKSRNMVGDKYRELGMYEQAIEWFDKEIKNIPGDAQSYIGLGFVYFEQEKYREAIEWFKKGIALQKDSCPLGCDSIAWAYYEMGEKEEALKWFKRSAQCNPKDIELYSFIMGIYRAMGQDKQGLEFLRERVKLNPEVKDVIALFDNPAAINEKIRRWIDSDIEEIIKICKENNIPVILQSYPSTGYQHASEILKKATLKHSLPFVDNYKVFQELLNRGESKQNLFASDGDHCNVKGYGIMAENVYDKMVEEGMAR